MVRHLTREEFLVSFLVDARGGCLEAQRLPGMRIWVPPDAVLSPSRIIFRLLRPEALPSPPQLDDCHGYACRILQLQSSSLRFQKPILIEMPHVAALQNGRELLVLRRNPESHSWKEHSFSMDDAALRETFGPFYESLSDAATLRDRRIVRIATTDVPGYLSVVSVHRRNRAVIGPDGGVIHSDVDPRIRVQFPPGSLQKKIPISLEVQQMPFSSFSEPGMGQVSVSPIVTVEPKRRKFRDNIQVQLPLPPDCPQSQDLSTLSAGLRLLFSIYEHGTRWEDVTDSVELTISDGGIASHPTRISARVWLVYAPEMNAAAVANRIYAAHHACPYIGRFLVYARRHDEHECQLRIMLITDDSADKTLECQENFSVVQTGSEVELTIGTRYRVEMAGNLVPLTKLDEVVAMSPAPFQENRVTVPVRVRDADRSFCGKVALLPLPLHEMEQELAPPATPVTTLSVQVPDHIVQMDGTLRQPHRKKKITDSYRRSMRDSDPIARSELDVMLVAAAVGGDWPQLAAELGLQEPEPNAMASSDEEKALAGLVAWGGDGNRLNEALRAIGREDVVKTCLSSITLIQDEGEAESARKRLDRNDGNEDKDNWELVKPVVGSGGISGGSTGEADDGRALPPESVDESMIVETGDDDEDYDLGGSGTRQHRERDLSDVSDHSIRTQSDSGDVLEPSLEEIVDMGRLRPPHDEEQDAQAAADRVDAYLDLVGQLELLMPDPETLLHDTALDNEPASESQLQEVTEQPYETARVRGRLEEDDEGDNNKTPEPEPAKEKVLFSLGSIVEPSQDEGGAGASAQEEGTVSLLHLLSENIREEGEVRLDSVLNLEPFFPDLEEGECVSLAGPDDDWSGPDEGKVLEVVLPPGRVMSSSNSGGVRLRVGTGINSNSSRRHTGLLEVAVAKPQCHLQPAYHGPATCLRRCFSVGSSGSSSRGGMTGLMALPLSLKRADPGLAAQMASPDSTISQAHLLQRGGAQMHLLNEEDDNNGSSHNSDMQQSDCSSLLIPHQEPSLDELANQELSLDEHGNQEATPVYEERIPEVVIHNEESVRDMRNDNIVEMGVLTATGEHLYREQDEQQQQEEGEEVDLDCLLSPGQLLRKGSENLDNLLMPDSAGRADSPGGDGRDSPVTDLDDDVILAAEYDAAPDEGQEECSEATIPLAFSCVPSNFELNIEEMDLESKIVRQELRPDLSSVPENLLLQEEDLDDGDDSITPSNVTSLYSMPDLKISGADEIDDADKPLPSGDGDCVERYEGEPQEEREVVETEEVLPDGTVVRRKVVRKMVRQETLERRERQQEEDGLGHQEQEHGGEVVETEEVLPDGTVVSRRTTTHVTSETKVLRETIDEQHPQDHDQGGGQEVKAVQEPTKSKKKKKRKK